jgi:hypothetical protein
VNMAASWLPISMLTLIAVRPEKLFDLVRMRSDIREVIQDRLETKAPHHESFEQLLKTKWEEPVRFLLGMLACTALIRFVASYGRLPFHVLQVR